MAHFEKTLASKEIFQGHVLRILLDTVELEDGTTSQREIVRHPGGAAVLPMTKDGQVYLVRQFRYAFGRELLEIPAGKLEPGEDPRKAALRELEEECGLRAGSVRSLGCIYPSVGYDDEIIHIYLATELTEIPARPDRGEFVTLEKHPLPVLLDRILGDEIHDAKTVTAILKAAFLLQKA